MCPVDQVFAHGVNDLSVVVTARANADGAGVRFLQSVPPAGA